MIIEKMELQNFRPYQDTTIIFSTSSNKNVTLIYGENGTGKTSFFQAINWCFYGREFDNKIIISKTTRLDGKYLKKGLEEGKSAEVSVKITFTHKNERFFMKRWFVVNKNEEKLTYSEDKVSLDSHSEGGENKKYDKEQIELKINSIIPVTIREYFFFDVEKIDKFSEVGNSSEIESSIRSVLGLDCLQNTKGYLHEALKHYDKLILSSNETDYNNILTFIQEKEKEKEELQKRKEKFQKDKLDLEKELEITRKKAEQYKEEKEARDAKDKIRDNIKEIEKEIKEKTIELHDELKKCYFGFSHKLQKQVKNLMHKWSEEGIFPSEKFNEDLINKTLKKCICLICGNKFKEGDSVYKHVETLKEDDIFSRDLEKGLNNFNGDIKDFITKGNNNFKEAKKKREEIDDLKNELDLLYNKETKLDSKITKNITDEDLMEIYNKQKLLDKSIPELNIRIVELIRKIKDNKEDLIKINKAKEKFKLKNKLDRENQEKSSYCRKSEDAIETILGSFSEQKRKEINRICKKLFNLMVWKESHFQNIELTKDYELTVFDRFEEPARPDLSAGEREVLSLAFITAMAKSSGKEIPFIIDTPFGKISKKPRKNIAEQIPSRVSQLVLFVTDTELTKESEEIYNKVTEKIWTIDFNQNTSISTLKEGKYVD